MSEIIKTFVIDDTEYKTQLTKKYELRKKKIANDPKLVKAFIPGTIREVYHKPGDFVKKNTPILILEAMKMRNSVLAPLDGEIKTIYVKTDYKVAKNENLFELK